MMRTFWRFPRHTRPRTGSLTYFLQGMMADRNSLILRLSMVLALAVAAVGCGDEETVSVNIGGGSDASTEDTSMDDTSMTDTSMDDTSMTDTSMEDTPMEDTSAAVDLCTNEADFPIVTSADIDPDTDGEQTVTGEAQDCGLSCLGDTDSRQCSVDCIVAATGVSDPCAGCYGDTVACSIENCLAPCATDPSGEGCTSCQEEFCLEDFYACTGLQPSEE